MKRPLSLITKLMFWFVLCICVPICIFLYSVILYKNNMTHQEIQRYASTQVDLLAAQYDWFFDSVEVISKYYYNDDFINKIADPNHNRSKLQFLDDQLELLSMQKVNNHIIEDVELQITIITLDGKIYGTNLYNTDLDVTKMEKTPWYNQLIKNPWNILWIKDEFLSDITNDINDENIYNIWTLKDPTTYTPTAFLIIDFKTSELLNLFKENSYETDALIVRDMYGQTVLEYGTSNYNLSSEISQTYKTDASVITTPSENHYMAKTFTKSVPWEFILLTTNTTPLEGFNNVFTVTYALLMLTCIIAVAFLIFIFKQIVRPINTLAQTMLLTQSGDLEIRSDINRRDEIGQLSKAYNQLLDKINDLMQDIVSVSEQKRKAEMQAIYTQIQPHFIFNTLTSVRSLIYTEHKEQADKALRSFTLLLRNTLSNEEELCTIEKEMSLAQNYIDIQQLSFEFPIKIDLKIDEEIRKCKIIKMITQPIIENAIMHGLKRKSGKKTLMVHFAKKDDQIHIIIKDNGKGCDHQIVFDNYKMEYNDSIGMQNIYNRIVLHYGDKYGIDFNSTLNVGTTVVLKLPLIDTKEAFYDSYNFGSR